MIGTSPTTPARVPLEGPLLPHVNWSGSVPSLPHEEGPRAWLLPEPDQSAAGRGVAGVTFGLVVGWFLAVARVSRSALRAWICLWTVAGLDEACWGGQAPPAKRLDRGLGQRAGVGRLRSVVLLGHLRAVADLGDQLLLRAEVVRHQRLQSQISFSSNNSPVVSYRW